MCLIINHRNLKTVPIHKEGSESNDKVVYKILLAKEGKYISPYRKHSYQLDCDTVDEEEADIKKIKEKNKPEFRVVGKGFLHSIRTLQAAQVQATKIQNQIAGLKNLSSWTLEIHKAIIPEGTKYYEGRNSDICSKTLRVLSEVITQEKCFP